MPAFTRKNGLKVNALKIGSVEMLTDGANLVPDDARFKPIKVDVNFIIVHRPRSGGYYVEYENGAKAFVSAESFERNYSEEK